MRFVMGKKILFFTLVLLVVASFLPAETKQNKDSSPADRSETQHVTGTIDRMTQGSVVVRVGDATQTFSFDNKTVFTYGDHTSNANELRPGDEVLVTALRDKAEKVNGTEQIEGIIEQIDTKGEKLIFKVGDQLKEIQFKYFQVAHSDGKMASIQDMKVGDSVLLNLNLGFWKDPDKESKP